MSIEHLIAGIRQLDLATPSTDSVSNANLEALNLSVVPSLPGSTENLNQTDNSENNDMAQFKPEYLNCVPVFDGNPNDLNRYLSTCQSLIDAFYDNNNAQNFQNIYLLNSLIGKLTGQAKLVVNIQNVGTWEQLKDTLRRNFADQRDEACLNRDLVMMKQQPNEKPNQFYDRVLHILNLLCSFIDSHETTNTAKVLKRNLYNELALKTFLSGLKEPLGTTIRCMRPTDLMQALQFVTQEYNIHYFQNQTRPGPMIPKNNNFRPPQNNNLNFSQPNFISRQNYSFNSQTPQNVFRPNFPSQPINVRPNFNRPPPRYPTNSQVFGKPSGQRTNVFRPNQQRNLPPPKPMSGVETSNFKPLPSTSNANHYGPPKLVFEEIYNAETQNIPEHLIHDGNHYQQSYNHDLSNAYSYVNNEYSDSHFESETNNATLNHDQSQPYTYDLYQQNSYEETSESNENFHETSQERQTT